VAQAKGCHSRKATCTREFSMDMTQLVRPGHQTVAIAAVELAERLHHSSEGSG